MGKLPCNNIEYVENQIENLEKQFNDNNHNINMDLVHKLMSLYQTAVEYYSAINSPQFQTYTDKIKKLMETKQINELIDKTKDSEQSISTMSGNVIKKEKPKEKEEKLITQGLNKIKNKFNSFSNRKEQKKEIKLKVSISKEDEDGGTLDVGSDDEEDEEEEDEKEEEKNKDTDIKKEEKNKEDIKEGENKNEEIKNEVDKTDEIKEKNEKE